MTTPQTSDHAGAPSTASRSAAKIERLGRDFRFNGLKLPDPNPDFSAEQVREVYTPMYPDLATAAITGPEAVGNKQVYNFTRQVGTKG